MVERELGLWCVGRLGPPGARATEKSTKSAVAPPQMNTNHSEAQGYPLKKSSSFHKEGPQVMLRFKSTTREVGDAWRVSEEQLIPKAKALGVRKENGFLSLRHP